MFIINTIWHDSDLTWWWQKSHFRRKPEFNWTIFFPQLQQFLIYSHFKNGINLWYLNSVVDGYRQMFCIFNLKSVQSKIIIYYNFRFLCVAEKFHASIFTLKWGKLWAWTFLRMSVWFCYSVRLICTMPSVTNLLAILIFLMLVISTSPIWRNLAHMLTKSIWCLLGSFVAPECVPLTKGIGDGSHLVDEASSSLRGWISRSWSLFCLFGIQVEGLSLTAKSRLHVGFFCPSTCSVTFK